MLRTLFVDFNAYFCLSRAANQSGLAWAASGGGAGDGGDFLLHCGEL